MYEFSSSSISFIELLLFTTLLYCVTPHGDCYSWAFPAHHSLTARRPPLPSLIPRMSLTSLRRLTACRHTWTTTTRAELLPPKDPSTTLTFLRLFQLLIGGLIFNFSFTIPWTSVYKLLLATQSCLSRPATVAPMPDSDVFPCGRLHKLPWCACPERQWRNKVHLCTCLHTNTFHTSLVFWEAIVIVSKSRYLQE